MSTLVFVISSAHSIIDFFRNCFVGTVTLEANNGLSCQKPERIKTLCMVKYAYMYCRANLEKQ